MKEAKITEFAYQGEPVATNFTQSDDVKQQFCPISVSSML
jgi:hypothetical protein